MNAIQMSTKSFCPLFKCLKCSYNINVQKTRVTSDLFISRVNNVMTYVQQVTRAPARWRPGQLSGEELLERLRVSVPLMRMLNHVKAEPVLTVFSTGKYSLCGELYKNNAEVKWPVVCNRLGLQPVVFYKQCYNNII